MELSHLIKYEQKSLYPKDYKHLLDVIKRASMMIMDESNGNTIAIDKRFTFRFNMEGKIQTVSMHPLMLFDILKSSIELRSGMSYKYSLPGEPMDFESIKID